MRLTKEMNNIVWEHVASMNPDPSDKTSIEVIHDDDCNDNAGQDCTCRPQVLITIQRRLQSELTLTLRKPTAEHTA